MREQLVQRRLARLRPVEREVALLRAAVARGHTDAQRKALDALALALGGNGNSDLAGGARRLAWSAGRPAPDESLALADEVESRVVRSNG